MTVTLTQNTTVANDVRPPPGTGATFDLDAPNIRLTILTGVIVTSADDVAVASDDDGVSLRNKGTVSAAETIGNPGAVAFFGDDTSVTNLPDGRIFAILNAVSINGDDSTVINRGTIQSAVSAGVNAPIDPNFKLVNNGDIGGDIGAFLRGGDLENTGAIAGNIGVAMSAGTTVIDNLAGAIIRGSEFAISAGIPARVKLDNGGKVDGDIELRGFDRNDVITNRGDIDGTVALGPGDDRFKGFGDSHAGEVFGQSGDDILIGGDGDEMFDGGADNDTLRGGRGRDILEGGGNEDIFDFNAIDESLKGSQRDKIMDLVRGTDEIDVSGIDAKTGVSGNQKFKWIGRDDFNDKKGELRYEDKGSKVIVQGDVNGDSKADFEIFVKVGSIGQNDFVL